MELKGRAGELAERAVKALEKLAEDPVLQVEAGPPVCPHCNTVNPEISVREDEGSGSFAEYAIVPTCNSCGQAFYAVPLEWATFTTRQEAQEETEKRGGIFNGNLSRQNS